jgi:putative membrane protein
MVWDVHEPVMMVIFLVAVFLIIIPLLRWMGMGPPSRHGHGPYPPSRTALDILNERFARGEIGKEEYEEKEDDLTGRINPAT